MILASQEQTTATLEQEDAHVVVGLGSLVVIYVALLPFHSRPIRKVVTGLFVAIRRAIDIALRRKDAHHTKLESSPSTLTPPSSLHSSLSDSYSSDGGDSILAAVSTLFLETGGDDEVDEYPNKKFDDPNKLVARIIPIGAEEYERNKPHDRQCDAVLLREMFVSEEEALATIEGEAERNNNSTQAISLPSESSSVFCSLQADVTLKSLTDPCVRHRIQLCLHRRNNETAHHSLKRLILSLERRYQQQEKFLKPELRVKKGGDKSSKHKSFEECMSASIWAKPASCDIINGAGQEDADDRNGADDEEEKEEGGYSPDGYERIPLSESTVFSALMERLSHYENSQLFLNLSLMNGDRNGEEATVCLPISACPPTILSVETFDDFCTKVFVGVPLVVEVKALHATRTIVTWFADQQEVVCRDSSVYVPQAKDIGKVLSVLIIPVRPGHNDEGCEEAYEFKNKVEALPKMPLISPLRDSWIVPRRSSEDTDGSSPTLRVMSYNILADLYTTREVDQQVMYNHCSQELLDRKRRMPMLLYEMLVYQADIICLQEVDDVIFNRFLRPYLESHGYQGYYSNKASSQLEGCAMFWSLRCFERVDDSDMMTHNLRDLFTNAGGHPRYDHHDRRDSLEDIDRILEENPALGRITRKKVGQVLQVARLTYRHKDSQYHPDTIVVGNTHMFYHPLADHIRAFQAYAVARQLDTVRRSQDDGDRGTPCPIVLCGDLNSNPLSGAVQLLMQHRIGPEHHQTWRHLNDYEWDMGDTEYLQEHGFIGSDVGSESCPAYEDEEFEDAAQSPDDKIFSLPQPCVPPQIDLPHGFPTLVSGYKEIPEFTNYAIDFVETLDYILASEASPTEPFGLAPLQSAPVPSAKEMEEWVAMPNAFMPSDHISLVCDLEWERYPCSTF